MEEPPSVLRSYAGGANTVTFNVNDDSSLVKKTPGFAPNGFRKAAEYRHNGDP
jgi:hypothetical protein